MVRNVWCKRCREYHAKEITTPAHPGLSTSDSETAVKAEAHKPFWGPLPSWPKIRVRI